MERLSALNCCGSCLFSWCFSGIELLFPRNFSSPKPSLFQWCFMHCKTVSMHETIHTVQFLNHAQPHEVCTLNRACYRACRVFINALCDCFLLPSSLSFSCLVGCLIGLGFLVLGGICLWSFVVGLRRLGRLALSICPRCPRPSVLA